MSVEKQPIEPEGTAPATHTGRAWRGGALAGLIATVVMGVVITAMNVELLRVAIAGLYGFPGNIVVGWIAHLTHGVLFGILFAALLSEPGLYDAGQTVGIGHSVAAGIVYGLVLAVVAAGIVMPIWLSLIGLTTLPSLPSVTPATVLWHLVYGAVLGALFPSLQDV